MLGYKYVLNYSLSVSCKYSFVFIEADNSNGHPFHSVHLT
jgi:hypothetical protein